MNKIIKVLKNNQEIKIVAQDSLNLFLVLKRNKLFGNVKSCNTGDCGVCEVQIGEKLLKSCQMQVKEVNGDIVICMN